LLNSSGVDLENLEIAFLSPSHNVDPATTKVADLTDAELRFRFGYWAEGNDPRYYPIYELPPEVMIEWTEDGVYDSRLVQIPEDIREYYNQNRNRRDGLRKYLTFEIKLDRTVSTYLYMWERPGIEPIYFPPREENGNQSKETQLID